MAFCVARAPGYPPVLLAEAGIGPGRRHHALAERAAQVGVALAGTAWLGAVPRLEGARGQPGPRGGVAGGGEHRHVGAEALAMRTRALHTPTPAISPSRATRPGTGVPSLKQPGECPPPISPQPAQARATPGMDASDAPVIGRRFEHQPLDALAHQMVHQRGHLAEMGVPTRQTFCRRRPARDPGTRVHTIPNPFATSIPAANSTTWVTSSDTSAASPPCACTPSPALSAFAFAFAFFLAATAASLSSGNQQDEAARAKRGETESDRRARSDSTPALASITRAHKLSFGLTKAPSKVRRHGQHPAIIRTPRPPPRPPPGKITAETARTRWTAPPPPATLEPVTAPAQAHGQHTCRQQHRPVTTRSRPADQVSREPHAANPQELSCRDRG